MTRPLTELLREKLAYNHELSDGEFGEGARWQIEDIAPILERLIACVEAADQMVARYEDAIARDPATSLLKRGMSMGVYQVLDETLIALRKAVGGE